MVVVQLVKKISTKRRQPTWRSTGENAPSVKRLNPSHVGLLSKNNKKNFSQNGLKKA